MRFPKGLLTPAAVLLLSLLCCSSAYADQVDQSFMLGYNFNAQATGTTMAVAQTYTAGLTGQLSALRFYYLQNFTNTGSGTTTIGIYNVTSGGQPGTTLLGSTTLVGDVNYNNVILMPPGIPQVATTMYAIVLQPDASTTSRWRGLLYDQYAGGNAYQYFGGSWNQLTYNGQGVDFSFETSVQSIPEPGTLLLLGAGLSGLWLKRRVTT